VGRVPDPWRADEAASPGGISEGHRAKTCAFSVLATGNLSSEGGGAQLVVSGGDAAELFEFVEEAFDVVALAVYRASRKIASAGELCESHA
jgi:hypothetical protein